MNHDGYVVGAFFEVFRNLYQAVECRAAHILVRVAVGGGGICSNGLSPRSTVVAFQNFVHNALSSPKCLEDLFDLSKNQILQLA